MYIKIYTNIINHFFYESLNDNDEVLYGLAGIIFHVF